MRLTTWDAILAFALAASVAWLLVPPAESLAKRIGAIDQPTERGLHDVPTPKLGGLAILAAVLVAGLIWLPLYYQTFAILTGAVVIAAFGVLDDLYDLPALPKLAGQVLGTLVAVVFGDVVVDVTTLPFIGGVSLGWVAYPITVIGIVAVINIVNLIDGVDGLAAGVCTISGTTLALIAISLGRYEAGVLAALTAGASLGFLRHGFPPASSFMGDTGSNLLGYLLATVAVLGSLKTNAALALALPLVVLAVPILDTGFVVAKRLKYRRPIYQADRWHFHHRMANIGFSQRRTLAYLYGWTLILAGLALALRFIPYSDDRGNFDLGWTIVMVLLILFALAASVYVIVVLEILKLRRVRLSQVGGRRSGAKTQAVDRGVERELETGRFETKDPKTGRTSRLDPKTGEMKVVGKAKGRPKSGKAPARRRRGT